jgi:hypothetical protein
LECAFSDIFDMHDQITANVVNVMARSLERAAFEPTDTTAVLRAPIINRPKILALTVISCGT